MSRGVVAPFTDDDWTPAVSTESFKDRDWDIVQQLQADARRRHDADHRDQDHPWCIECEVRIGRERDEYGPTPGEALAAWNAVARGTVLTDAQKARLADSILYDDDDDIPALAAEMNLEADQVEAAQGCLVASYSWENTAKEVKDATRSRIARYLLLNRKPPATVTEAAREPLPPFDAGTLADIRNRPDEPPHRVEGLIPSEASTLIVAQRKTGKTTVELNLARSLLTGEQFLGRFDVRPAEGTVALLNYEVSAQQLGRWAHDVGVPEHRLFLVNLRGRRNPLANAADRERLAELLKAHNTETVIVDPFGRAYTGASQNDPGEVGAFLGELDRFARSEVGARDLVLTAHAGWQAERARGSSALEDWADSIITMTRNEDGSRWLRALGRDVDVDEDQLQFDPDTRLLTLTGNGSREKVAANQKTTVLIPYVVRVVTATPGMGIGEITTAIRSLPDAPAFRDRDVSKACTDALGKGFIDAIDGGAGRKKQHFPIATTNPVQPRPDPVHGRGTTTPSTPSLKGRGVVVGGSPETDTTLDRVDCSICGQQLLHPTSVQRGTCERCNRVLEVAS